MSANSEHKPMTTVECRYISMNHTHIHVEYTTAFGSLDEAWIPLDKIDDESINIFDDIMELEVDSIWVDRELNISTLY